MYTYHNFNDENIISIKVKFINMSKKVVGYDRGICIEIKSFTSDYDEDNILTTFSYPYSIYAGKVLWGNFKGIEKDHNLDLENLKKFCERIVKFKIFE